MRDYQRVADAVAADIAAGRLRPGDRLPPQRRFARDRGIAASTAARVYQELARRGLTVGEVGRGTFVRAVEGRPAGPALSAPPQQRINLELNYPVVPEQAALLSDALGGLLRPDALDAALRPVGATGTPEARTAAVRLLARADWRPCPDRLLFTGNGRQAISAAVAALVPPGGRLGAEELTYPVLKSIAGRLGVTVVPLAMDEEGVRPDALAAAHRTAPLHAVYVQPTLHNPLSLTMPPARRAELAAAVRQLDVPVIEDTIWAFLSDGLPPLAALAPERTVVVDSVSKRLAPGLTVGFAVVPEALAPSVEAAVRSGGWLPSGFALEAATRWEASGTVEALVRAKRQEVEHRQDLVARHLSGFAVRTDPHSCFCWWELPPEWRADLFVAAASRQGIAVTPASAFTADPHRAPNAVRLGLASPDRETLAGALRILAAVAASPPGAEIPA
ncbi:aminotransferase-like domain-containing protein [Streptomyces thermolilacinus]|uniref:GntR family transcriptional regulator n=1 Tax=Streptomyces thermolilacinus SPC6 TaxID=1306406 RepID=A0A1D3E0B4_9ACTN|nr:PLP-dependent aminotransferase family protein [Streptomyces thermolilacinus]OEJ98016.1 GntR family transcriptional regulator [Streptomyces thermolilacinus SPC6]